MSERLAKHEGRAGRKRALIGLVLSGAIFAGLAPETHAAKWQPMIKSGQKTSPNVEAKTELPPSREWVPITRREPVDEPKQGGVDTRTVRMPTRAEESRPWVPQVEEEIPYGEDRPVSPAEAEKEVEMTPEDLSAVKVSPLRFTRTREDGTLEMKEISAEQLRQILAETYPRGWVKDEVSEIKQENRPHLIGYLPASKKLADRRALATCSHEEDKPNTIVFYDVSFQQSPRALVDALGHEIAHSNDWETDDSVPASTLEALERAITDRLTAPDRFRSSYVESISQTEKIEHKKEEYWAEICAQYLEDATVLSVTDFELVDNFVRSTDPQFNWRESAERRVEILNKQ